MFFAAPIWLFGLIPWGIVAVVLLMSRRPRQDVPFLELWRLNAPQESIRRSFSTPPIGVVLALLATLLAILAAAGLAFRRQGVGALTVIVDTGAGTSATSTQPDNPSRTAPRFALAIERASAILQNQDATDIPIDLIVIPDVSGRYDAVRIPASNLNEHVANLRRSALDATATVDRIVRQRLTDPDARVVLISGRGPVLNEASGAARFVLVPPPPAADNVGIVRLAVRREPMPQAMIRLQRNSAATAVRRLTVRVSSAGKSVDQQVDLPPDGRRDLFVPMPAVGRVVNAELFGGAAKPDGSSLGYADAFSADDRADLVAEADWPVIEAAVSVGELQRLIDVYGRSRPAGERSTRLRLSATPAELGASAGIILAAVGRPAQPTRVTRIADHPSLDGADLSSIDLPAALDRTLPPDDWQPILFDAAGPLLAVRQSADPLGGSVVRQAWCAIDPRGWAQHVAYVVFWSALFEWTGGASGGAAGEHLIVNPLESLAPEWKPLELAPGGEKALFWPGIYQRDDGIRRAFGPATFDAGNAASDAGSVESSLVLMLREGHRVTSLSGWLSVIALTLAGAAATVWRRKTFRAPVFE